MIGYKAVVLTLVLTLLVGTCVFAQSQSATELYGRGVHAYFASNYKQAVELLTRAIKERPTDPRGYYYRGLALARLNDLKAGAADFAKGADVEFNKADKPYEVNIALQREQGHLRLAIEKQRALAKVVGIQRKMKRERVRYEEQERREEVVVFSPDRPAPKVDIPLPEPNLEGVVDPFESGDVLTGGKEVDYAGPDAAKMETPDPATPDTSQPTDPFAKPTPKTTPVAPKDPFATPGESTEDPPMDDGPAEAPDPFRSGTPDPPPDASTPDAPAGSIFGILGKTLSGKTSNRDPFGDGGGDPAEKQDDTQPPAKDDTQPPAKEDATTDPFADPNTPGTTGEPPAKTETDEPAKTDPKQEEDPFK